MSDEEREKKRIIDEILNSLPPEPGTVSESDELSAENPEAEETAASDSAEDDIPSDEVETVDETPLDEDETKIPFDENDISDDENLSDDGVIDDENASPDDGVYDVSDASDVSPDDDESDYDVEFDDEYDDELPKRRRRNKSSAGHLIIALLLAAVIVSLSVLGAAVILGAGQEMMGLARSDNEIVLDIPENMTTDELADLLISEGIIGSKRYFLYFTRIRSLKTLVSGFHEFRPNMTYGEIADELQSGATNNEEAIEVNVTFPEGIRLTEAAAKLEAAGVCSAAEFLSEFNSLKLGYSFEDRVENKLYEFYPMEGYCFPDTYSFYLDENVKSVVQKIFRNTENKLTPDLLARASDLGLTQDELITFASIVQREVPSLSDMRTVSSVFWNRQNDDTFYPKRFESCTTQPYIDEVIVPFADYADVNMLEAYDTYEITGLPPGPICNPGLDAINAVLYPVDTDYFYFCSNLDTKETFFAKTLDEQEENMVLAGLA
jgi:UPF0755 protein